jgi:hypothetical protein
MECKYDGCQNNAVGWGYCQKHYRRYMKYGSPESTKYTQEPLEIRFWRFVDKRSDNECWPWTGNKNLRGYGRFSVGKKIQGSEGAHRVSWKLHNNQEIPHKMHIMHKCDNPICVNPNHLVLGTAKENTHDMIAKGRKRTVAPVGDSNGKAILNAEKVRLIRSSKLNHAELGRQLGVSPSCIRGVRSGRTWSHIEDL